MGAGGARLVEGLDGGDGVSGEAGAAWVAAGGACCGDSGGGAFGGDGSLELGDGAEDVEDESSAGCGGVDGFGEGAQFDAAVLEPTCAGSLARVLSARSRERVLMLSWCG